MWYNGLRTDYLLANTQGVKNFAYGAVDVVESGVESIGNGIHRGLETVKSVGKNVSDFFNGGLKAASSLFG